MGLWGKSLAVYRHRAQGNEAPTDSLVSRQNAGGKALLGVRNRHLAFVVLYCNFRSLPLLGLLGLLGFLLRQLKV